MVQATFPSATAAGTITIYPADATHGGVPKSHFLDGVKLQGTGGALTQAAIGLKAIEYRMDTTFNDITGV